MLQEQNREVIHGDKYKCLLGWSSFIGFSLNSFSVLLSLYEVILSFDFNSY